MKLKLKRVFEWWKGITTSEKAAILTLAFTMFTYGLHLIVRAVEAVHTGPGRSIRLDPPQVPLITIVGVGAKSIRPGRGDNVFDVSLHNSGGTAAQTVKLLGQAIPARNWNPDDSGYKLRLQPRTEHALTCTLHPSDDEVCKTATLAPSGNIGFVAENGDFAYSMKVQTDFDASFISRIKKGTDKYFFILLATYCDLAGAQHYTMNTFELTWSSNRWLLINSQAGNVFG